MVLRKSLLIILLSVLLALVAAQCAPVTVVETVVVKETVEVEKIVEVEKEAAPQVTITLAYNRFLNSSFGPGPAPIDAIKQVVAEKYPHIDIQLNLMPELGQPDARRPGGLDDGRGPHGGYLRYGHTLGFRVWPGRLGSPSERPSAGVGGRIHRLRSGYFFL